MTTKTDHEVRLLADALAWYEVHHADPDRDEHETRLKRALAAVIAERATPRPVGQVEVIRESPDGPILPGFDPRTGQRIT